ncbi:coiled-coil domain-containing protein 125-like isoform X1 [Asterias rubens]|uniref:coiled-coil domain-containing protein 125-like isoform X1 n=1 Tax=Asterias rubens TaxID=7604 RepID=UPI0014555B8A|nr:coiled-coil domain-containing protein 125-like isoform X1 [Asterias rubens]
METMRRISYSAFDKSDSDGESCQKMTKGDLGFGLGLLPGAVVIKPTSTSNSSHRHCKEHSTCHHGSRTKLFDEEEVFVRNNNPKCLRCNEEPNDSDTESRLCCCCESGLQPQSYFGDHDSESERVEGSNLMPRLRSVVRKALMNQRKVSGSGDNKVDPCSSDEQVIFGLELASQEVIELQSDLEATKRQLNSKYRAIQILKSQFAHVVMINKEHSKSIQEAKCMKTSLEKEVNGLQFDLSATRDCSMMTQQTWAERYDRVCLENRTLETNLQEYVEQLRMARLDNLGLKQERDELLAMMDVKERLGYNRNKSCNLFDTETHCTAQELAVLGACLCRGTRPNPCGCARVAAGLKKENYILKYEMDQLRQNLDATQLMADSFRTAFDHQLDQNICEKITSLCQDERRGDGPSGNQSNGPQESRVSNEYVEDDQQSTIHNDGEGFRSIAVQASQPLPDLISTLADLLNDKTEALVHQRLVAKMLARKTQDLEKTMQQLNDYSNR